MNTIDPFDELQTDWQLPDWTEIVSAIRSQFWLLLLINALYSGGVVFLRWTGHPILLFFPQMMLGLLLTLAYFRMIIDPGYTVSGAISKAAALLPFAIWIMLLKMMASVPGFLFLVLPGLYISARLILAEALVAADRPGISDHPLKASWKLTETHAGLLCGATVLMVACCVLVMMVARKIGASWQPSVILLRALLWLPVSIGWMGFTATCSAKAISFQRADLFANSQDTANPAGWVVWFMRVIAGLGLIVAFIILMLGVGYLATTSAGSKVMRSFMRLNSTGGNVIIHGKTVLLSPIPWIASPEQNFPGSQAVSFRLTAIGGIRGVPLIRVAWLPISAPSVIDQLTAQRLSGLVVRGMDALELEPVKVIRKLYDLQQRELAEYHVYGQSLVQNPEPRGWLIIRARGNPPRTFKRDRFMSWDGGLLVFSDTRYSSHDDIKAEMLERPLLEALKLQ